MFLILFAVPSFGCCHKSPWLHSHLLQSPPNVGLPGTQMRHQMPGSQMSSQMLGSQMSSQMPAAQMSLQMPVAQMRSQTNLAPSGGAVHQRPEGGKDPQASSGVYAVNAVSFILFSLYDLWFRPWSFRRQRIMADHFGR